jgi:transposase
MGKKKALITIAHKLLIACYHIIKYKIPYKELGTDHFIKGKEEKIMNHYIKKLQQMGYNVNLQTIGA